jgi:hypothetical protein
VAARAAASPPLPLETLAAELRVPTRRLDAMDTGDAATSLRMLYSCSYGQLTGPAARMFRLLSVHPGPDVTVPAAASLAAIPADQTRAVLRELARCHLVTEQAGRFAFHSLLRAYAAERARAEDGTSGLRRAFLRALDHYAQAAHAAASQLLRPDDHKIGPAAAPARSHARRHRGSRAGDGLVSGRAPGAGRAQRAGGQRRALPRGRPAATRPRGLRGPPGALDRARTGPPARRRDSHGGREAAARAVPGRRFSR